MKRLFYALTLVAVLAATLSSCTDENVQPKANDTIGGGSGIPPDGKS